MKHKFSLLFPFTFFITSVTMAQIDSLSSKKIKIYKWQISAAINSVQAQIDQELSNTWTAPYINYYQNYGNKNNKSLSLSIIPKYYLTDNILLRFEFGITSIALQSTFNGYGDTIINQQPTGQVLGSARTIAEHSIKQNLYRYVGGVQWNVIKKKHIELYCGGLLNYIYYKDMQWKLRIRSFSPNSSSLSGRETYYDAITPGGFASGLGFFSGANIFVNKFISLGGDFSYSLLYYKIGGIQSGFTTDVFPNTPTETSSWKIYNNSSKGMQFSKIMPSLNLTIRF